MKRMPAEPLALEMYLFKATSNLAYRKEAWAPHGRSQHGYS